MFKSFKYAFRGLRNIWKDEPNFRLDVLIAVIVLSGLYVFDFSYLESALVVFAVILILTGEALNTVVERTLDIIQPHRDPFVGKIKDMMAGVVLIIAIGILIIGLLIFSGHFGIL